MAGRVAPGSADFSHTALSVDRVAKVASECLIALGPVLGLSHCRLLGQLRTAPTGLSGMAVLIEGGPTSVVVAVLSNPEGRVAVARTLFHMAAGDQPQAKDEADALGELANVIAGRIKVALSAMSMRLSVPQQWAANIAPDADQVTLRISFGSVPAALVVGVRPG